MSSVGHTCLHLGVNQQAQFDTETEVMGEIRGTLQATVDSVNGIPTTQEMLEETFTGAVGGDEDGIMTAAILPCIDIDEGRVL